LQAQKATWLEGQLYCHHFYPQEQNLLPGEEQALAKIDPEA